MPSQIIIHISGVSGSGKTTLGNKLKDKFGNKIIVKDTDDLRDEFIKKFYGNKKWIYVNHIEYQKYINDYVNKQKKPLIFVGLNDNNLGNKKLYYNLHSSYNYYIKIDDMQVVKQKCLRFFQDVPSDKIAMDDLMNNNEHFIKMITQAIKRECGATETIKINKKWNSDYKKQGYKFMSREEIYKEMCKILNKIIQ